MSHGLFKPLLPSSGRAILIAITVSAAAGGFTLGYYVGKNNPSYPAKSVTETQARADQDNLTATPAQSAGSNIKTEESPSMQTGSQTPDSRDNKAQPQARPPETSPSKEKPDAEGKKEDEKAVYYTVQAGASKSLKGAETLKRTLENKGYKVYIKKEADSRGKMVFKVRVGEFESRKDANLMALKLKKTEGLSAFVSTKN